MTTRHPPPASSPDRGAPKRSRAHHYVPQSYLRSWAENGRIAVRRRGASSTFIAATARVAQETDLYTVDTAEGPSDLVERGLARLERHLPECLAAMRRGSIPPRGTPGRELFSSLLALQFVRTPDQLELNLFPDEAIRAAGGTRPIPEQIVQELLTEHSGYAVSESEVRGATDFVNFVISQDKQLTREQNLDILFRAIPTLATKLAGMSWSLEQTRGITFVTSDQPLTLWVRRPSPVAGVGISHAEEVRFPLGPRYLLVLRPRGAENARLVRNTRVSEVNEHMAATCRHMVIARPCDVLRLENLRLRSKRPMWKINEGPLYRQKMPAGQYTGEVMHFFRPYDDRGIDEYPG